MVLRQLFAQHVAFDFDGVDVLFPRRVVVVVLSAVKTSKGALDDRRVVIKHRQAFFFHALASPSLELQPGAMAPKYPRDADAGVPIGADVTADEGAAKEPLHANGGLTLKRRRSSSIG